MLKNRRFTAFLIGIACFVPLAAEDSEPTRAPAWGSMYASGNAIPGGQIAIEGSGGALVLSAAPSLELIVWKPSMLGTAPLDIGLQVMGRVALPLRDAGAQLGFGAGGSVHMGLRGLELPISEYLDNVDLFARFGLGYALTPSDGPGLVGYSSSGFNYFLGDRLYLGLAYTQWGYFGGVSAQGGIRLGKSSSVSGMGDVWEASAKAIDATAEAIFVSRFYAYYFTSFYTGGYYFPAPYKVGDSTVYRIRDRESGSSYFIERALLAADADGGRWWRLKFWQGDESVLYEFRMQADTRVSEIYYSENGGPAVRVVPSKADMAGYYDGAIVLEDFEREAVSKETVRVGAGRYEASLVSRSVVDDDGSARKHSWWLADSVPGGLVKYAVRGDDADMELSLESVRKGTEFQLRGK